MTPIWVVFFYNVNFFYSIFLHYYIFLIKENVEFKHSTLSIY
jgi:hypothetical protein